VPTRRKGSAVVAGRVNPPINMAQYQGTKRGGGSGKNSKMKNAGK